VAAEFPKGAPLARSLGVPSARRDSAKTLGGRQERRYDYQVPRFVFVDGPRDGVVDFRNLLPGEIAVGDSFYRLTNRTRNGIVEYLWQQPVTTPPPQPKKREKKRAPKRKT
jgi:hypothetical protein